MATVTQQQEPRPRRVFGGALNGHPGPSREHSRSPNRSPALPNSSSSQSPDQLSLSGNEEDREPPTLSCPICNETMITLLQLNRHLDDVHREVEEVQKETVKSWFKKRMVKAKSLPPVVALNQKFGKTEVFERNGDVSGTPGLDAATATDDIVTRKHWQHETGNDYCSEPSCAKFLNNKSGHINCRKCGKLFCNDHTMYQIKLSMSAQWEPVRGTWCRVCETCYKTREGYSDTEGAFQDHTAAFRQTRQKMLLSLMANPPRRESSQGGLLKALTGGQTHQRQLEQTVVTWQDDEIVSQCPFCQLPFNFSNRKHHCRLCGRVVCGNPMTGCSTNVGLNVTGGQPEKHNASEMSVDVRMCQECKSIVFGKRDFARESAKTPKYVSIYQNMSQFRIGIEQLLPKFKSLVFLLRETESIPTKAQLEEAHKVRKRLIDLFTQYDAISKRILQSTSSSPTDLRVQTAMNQAAKLFLQQHMLPLQSIPKVLRGKEKSPLAANGNENGISDAKEKELKEKMMVLEEQKYLVENMIEQAKKGRKMEEVAALKESVKDLAEEIEKIKRELGDLFVE